MFFILSKILSFLTYPLIWILLLLILAYIFRSKHFKKKLLFSALFLFIFFSNSFIFYEVFKLWEGKNEVLTQINYDAIVLLGGYSSWNTRHQSVTFNESSDRFIKTFELYQGKVSNKILLSGGSGLVLKPEEKESANIKVMLEGFGVNPNDIILEKNSRNTHENAIFSADILNERFQSDAHFLLITSAFHMRRSQRCFDKTGLNFEYVKVDFQVDDDDYTLETYIIPSAQTLHSWQILIKEWIGYVVYWLKGYF